jgi:UDPglucose 6-dehydrogenase
VLSAVESIGRAIGKKRGYHLVVLTSTVMPGSMDNFVAPALEKASGRRLGEDLGLCYSPELIALGNVIRGLREPEVVIVGASDQRAASALIDVRRKICDRSPNIARMNFVNAELAKLALNSFVTMKMSFANTLAEMCEKLPGADVDVVTAAIGTDKRIGRSNLKGALGYGGPCFPRDNIAFAEFARRIGAQAELATATHSVNTRQHERVAKLVETEFDKGATVAVMGLAYKTGTSVVESSQSMALVSRLLDHGYKVSAYDPELVGVDAHQVVPRGTLLADSVRECLLGADVCVIATPWPEFRSIGVGLLEGKTVIDCWRILPNDVAASVRYIPIGRFVFRRKRVVSSVSPSRPKAKA